MRQALLKTFDRQQSEQGVSLLLAMLVLSSILAISFSLATVLLVEIRGAGDLLRTEPALYLSYGVTEEAVFQVKRKTGTSVTARTEGSVQVAAPIQNATSTPVIQLVVKPSSGFAEAESRVYFFNPGNIYAGSGYGKVRVRYLDTGNLEKLRVHLCQYDPVTAVDPCASPVSTENNYFVTNHTSDGAMVARGATPWEHSLNSSMQQELVLVNVSSENMYVILETFDADGVTPKGPPFAGETSIEVESTNKGLKRRIQTIIPTN